MSVLDLRPSQNPERCYLFCGGDLVLPPAEEPRPSELPRDAAEQRAETRPWFDPAWLEERLPSVPGIERRVYPLVDRSGHIGRVCEALRLPAGTELSWLGSPRVLPFRAALGGLRTDEFAEACKGIAFLNWIKISQCCGCCGEALADDPVEGFKAGARRCPSCGQIFYPHISPAVIVAIRRDERLLLAHNARFPAGRFGLIAGFVEAGENLEEALRREIREETGIEVKNLRYRYSQTWPFPDSLMLAYVADWVSGEGVPDGEEIAELRWCRADSLPDIPPGGSVARRLIDDFRAGAI